MRWVSGISLPLVSKRLHSFYLSLLWKVFTVIRCENYFNIHNQITVRESCDLHVISLQCCNQRQFSYFSQLKSDGIKFSRVSLVGIAGALKLSSQVFSTVRTSKNTFSCTIPSLYLLQVIHCMVHWGHSSQLSSHLHFGQTRDCGDMRSAKDQQEPPLPSPGIEEQQKGHQTKGGPSVSQ